MTRKPCERPSSGKFGIIGIHQHRVDCIIGIYPPERQKIQIIYVNVKIKVDFTLCIQSGKISDSVDYASIAQLCTNLALKKDYQLIEAFASDILEECKAQFKPCWAWVQIQKPSAIPSAEYAFVEMEYDQKDYGI